MSRDALLAHAPPPPSQVFVAQLRATALRLRQPVLVCGSLLLAVTLWMALMALRGGQGLGLDPELGFLLAPSAALLPMAVWKGEYRLRGSYLASLPVDRSVHALLKISAGWVWLMVLILLFLLWMWVLARATGGVTGEAIRVVASPDSQAGAATRATRWFTPAWQWVAMFSGPTVAYLFGSAVVLAGSRVRRWLAGLLLTMVAVLLIDGEAIRFGLTTTPETAIMKLGEGPWGLETVVTGRRGPTEVVADDGTRLAVWLRPDPRRWFAATLLWAAAAFASVLAAVRREPA